MKILRWFAVSFSLYSRIPMAHFAWKEDDMAHSLIFFPWVGLIIGICEYVAYMIATRMCMPQLATIIILGLIPIAITGGFHLDGYMDVTDAVRSYQPKEKKLEILKDPHIGAFAVIGLVKLLALFTLALALIVDNGDSSYIMLLSCIFICSRCVSGISSILLKKSKDNGMLVEETKKTGRFAIIVLCIWMGIAVTFGVYISIYKTLAILAALVGSFIYYKYLTDREFGGVSGDTAGYLVCISECVMFIALAICTLV